MIILDDVMTPCELQSFISLDTGDDEVYENANIVSESDDEPEWDDDFVDTEYENDDTESDNEEPEWMEEFMETINQPAIQVYRHVRRRSC